MSRYWAARNCGIASLCLLTLLGVGCRTEIKSPTASPYYLLDGHEYCPSGPEFKLSNQVQALEEYKLERAKLRASADEDED